MDSFKKIYPFFLGLALSISLLWPLFSAPFFTSHDDVQVIRLYEMDKCFKDGQIPCRWVPDLGGLYGYPLFNYYAPLPYYFGELIYFITHSLLISVKVMFIVAFLASYIFMYLLARKFWGNLGAGLSAVFYSFAPYHALDFYVRGAMGEMWGLIFFPALLWALVRLEENPKISNLLLISVFWAGLITSHNLSAMIFLPFCFIWGLLLFFKRKSKKFLYFGIGSVILGIMLSAFYLLPVIFEKDLVHLETTIEGYFSYTEHFKGFKKLFLERSWGYGASVREVPGGEKDGLSYQIGIIHLFGWLFAAIAAKILWKKHKWLSSIIIFSSLAILFSAFMINPRSEFLWKIIDPLKYLQFPWRFLSLIIFFVSFISGSIFSINFKYRNLLWTLLVSSVIIVNFAYFKPEKFIYTTDQMRLSGQDWDKQIMRSIFDYLPIYAKEPPAKLSLVRYELLTGNSGVYDFKEGTNWITFKTITNSHTIIRLSQYYFPDWRIDIDGKRAVVEYKNNSLGLMTIILGKGDHIISARLYDTPIRSFADGLTVMGFAITAFLFFTSFPRVRKWITYYRIRIN